MMFGNKRRDREICELQQEVEYLNTKFRKLRQRHGMLLIHLGIEERYIKEEIILVQKDKSHE